MNKLIIIYNYLVCIIRYNKVNNDGYYDQFEKASEGVF